MSSKILIYCKYEACADGFELVVLELSKKSAVTVCRLSMAALLSVEAWSAELAKKKKAERSLKIYNYCVDISPTDAYLLSFSDSTYSPGQTPICVKIQCDEAFLATLKGFVPKQNP